MKEEMQTGNLTPCHPHAALDKFLEDPKHETTQ